MQEKVSLVYSYIFFGSVYIHCTSFSESVIYVCFFFKRKPLTKKRKLTIKTMTIKTAVENFEQKC